MTPEVVAGLGAAGIDQLAAYLASPGVAAAAALVDAVLEAMSPYSAHYVPLLRVAVGQGDAAGRLSKLLRLAAALHGRGDSSADAVAGQAVALAERTLPEADLAGVLQQAAACVSSAPAIDYLTRALETAPDPDAMAPAIAALARRLIEAGRGADARARCLSRVARRAGAFGPRSAEAAEALDWTARVLADLPDALDFAGQSLALREALGDPAAIAQSLETIAVLLEAGESFAEAEAQVQRAIALAEGEDCERLRRHLLRVQTLRLRAEARDREWDHAVALAERKLGAAASPFDLAVEALLQARPIFAWPLPYTLACEAAVLLAGAGRCGAALELVRSDLAETPARWDAAAVHVAIAGHRLDAGDASGAAEAIRQAAAAAQAVERIYERTGAYPAVYDLLDALAAAGRTGLTAEAASVLTGGAAAVFAEWQAETAADAPVPADADERLVLAAVDTGDGECDSAYAAIATMVAAARAAGDSETCARALWRGLDLLAGYGGEEGYRALIYHEDGRFAAAHGLGAAARRLLDAGARRDFARDAIGRARQLADAFAGAALMVAAGEASRG
jgi:hypothetical protein